LARVAFEGIEIVADVSGALWLPTEETLVVADLHLEKGSAFARRGVPLPPYDSLATIARLEDARGRLRPRRVVALGDSFHDVEAAARLGPGVVDRLAALIDGVEWLWLLGNHDPRPPDRFAGAVAETWAIGPLVFRHEPTEGPAPGEVAGHLHPKAAVDVRGRRVGARCFVSDGRRLLMPAFGAYAGGLDVFEPPIRRLFPRGFHAYMLGRGGVHPIAAARLTPRVRS
jgi:DNA ligase-associated metallophosphoesterase